ncbi:CG0192-related protein [Actinophytocola gossypii]|uniref:Maltokinase N-terminal cap domain-containing protein n=1 Tax=Actinophytocola gossypii TaxID=2812003 RepID=A0ABT2JIZ9_9PSEU|nr:hypothetical protein [Actinophytocola gossypii]MCT2587857.1 hypothetical protein [Actinophytocola gossypii]
MALIHRATIQPTKLELLTKWLPSRGWCTGPVGELTKVAGYRFDDPAGEVGIETLLVRTADGTVFQVPLTYRAEPLAGGDEWLIGTAEHSVLGKRWVYDALGDPVYPPALAAAVLANTGQAEELREVDGRFEVNPLTMDVASTGRGDAPTVNAVLEVTDADPARIRTDTVELVVRRRLGAGAGVETEATGAVLTGTWPDQTTPVSLAYSGS